MTELLIENINTIYLLYGLAFFLLGFAISIRSKRQSRLVLANKLWLLATFAYLHALGEWAVIYIPSQVDVLPSLVVSGLNVLPTFLWATSFLALFSFGIELCVLGKVLPTTIRFIPIGVFLLWYVIFTIMALTKSNLFYVGYQDWLVFADILARYFLGAPGAVFSAWGLYLLKYELAGLGSYKVMNYLRLAAVAFLLYGITAGLIVQKEVFFPASVLNVQNFIALTGIPVELVRSVLGFLITLSLINVLEIFDLENQKRMRRIEQQQALITERNRISRDLHDGAIQSLYAVGLSLQSIRATNPKNSSLVGEMDNVLQRIDEVIKDIRKYIQYLVLEPEQNLVLSRRVQELAKQIEHCKSIKVNFAGAWDRPLKLTPAQKENYYFIAKEALSNVVQHAQAKEVVMTLSTRGGILEMSIKDDGTGFDQIDKPAHSCHGLGLKNMVERAHEMGGQVKIKSTRGTGTEVIVSVAQEEC